MSKKLHVTWRRSLRAAAAIATASLVVVGCSGGYDIPLPADFEPPQGDIDCRDDMEPSQGDVCTQDCLTATCASGVGRRICTCEGGVFLQCACLPPANWPFEEVPAAPYCDSLTGDPRYLSGEVCTAAECRSSRAPQSGCHCVGGIWQCGSSEGIAANAPSCESFGKGYQATLKNKPCDTEWQLCIARDYNPTGTSPRGCVCQKDGAQLAWTCGATNRWWRAE
jgi:hypothetical protein